MKFSKFEIIEMVGILVGGFILYYGLEADKISYATTGAVVLLLGVISLLFTSDIKKCQ